MNAFLALIERTYARQRAATTAPPPPARAPVLTRAELAECTCPDACERDHEND